VAEKNQVPTKVIFYLLNQIRDYHGRGLTEYDDDGFTRVTRRTARERREPSPAQRPQSTQPPTPKRTSGRAGTQEAPTLSPCPLRPSRFAP
jgi:hypothetical protein